MTLQELKELAEKVKSTPWTIECYGHDDDIYGYKINDCEGENIVRGEDGYLDKEDADFIAAANPLTVLQLIERCEKLSEAISRAQKSWCIAPICECWLCRSLSLYGFEVPLK